MATIVLRIPKGSALTYEEVDANFENLNTDKAELASPDFTGVPTAPTAAADTNTTQIATTAYVQTELLDMAPLASPAFTGNPTAPTPAANDNDTSIATTAYVQTELADYLTLAGAASTYAPLASPAFTGNPTAPTPAANDNDTSIATTGFVQAELSGLLSDSNAFAGANSFTNATGQVFRQAATQDGILLRGRAGGSSNRTVELVPTTLGANRTLTLPDASGTVALTTGNVATATALQTPRTINGVAFDGTTNITIPAGVNFGLTLNNSGSGDASGTVYDGDTAVTLSYNTIGAAGLGAANAFTGANTFVNATGQVFRQAGVQDGILLRGRAGGTSTRHVELVPAALGANRTLTLPDASGTIALTSEISGFASLSAGNAFTGANTFINTTGQTFRRSSIQDGVLIRGRGGGTSSRTVELIPASLTASRTLTLPDADGTLALTSEVSGFASLGSNNTFTATNTFNDGVVFSDQMIYTVKSISTSGGSLFMAANDNSLLRVTVNGNVTLASITVSSTGQKGTIVIVKSSSSYTFSGWSATYFWRGGSPPDISSMLVGHRCVVNYVNDGTNLLLDGFILTQ